MRKPDGFTLIELLTAISLIIILAAILMPAAGIVMKKAKATKAQADIESLSVALKMYETDFGVFPPAASGTNNFKTYLGMELKNTSIGNVGPYMELKEKSLSGNVLNDPWGKAYQYSTPGAHNTGSFDIYSFGPDKTDNSGGSDDVNNW